MKRTLFALVGLALVINASAWVYNTYVSVPTTVQSGTEYYIYGYADSDGYGYVSVVLFKDGSYYADRDSNTGNCSIYEPALDYGTKTVQYDLYGYDDDSSGSATASINVQLPAMAPMGAFESITGSALKGQNVIASGWAVDLEMGAPVSHVDYFIDGNYAGQVTLSGYRPDIQAAKGSWSSEWQSCPYDLTYSGWSQTYNTAGLSLGTHSMRVVAYDNQGLSTDLGTKNFTVMNNAPDGATVSTGGVTQIPLGQSVNLSGTLHDPDSNLAYHNLYYKGPANSDWVPLLSGAPSANPTSTLSISFTPNISGTWYFHSNGHDGSAWGPGATTMVTVIDNTPPNPPEGSNGGFKVHKP
jgi:hypothetical protein